MNKPPVFPGSLDSKEASAINIFKSVPVLISSVVIKTLSIDHRCFQSISVTEAG